MANSFCWGATLIFSCLLFVINATIQCQDAYSCMSTSVRGSNEDIQCRGSHSCYNGDITVHGMSSTISCDGLFSCKMATIEQNTNGNIQCAGEGSCESSIIRSPTNVSSNLFCDGYRSCANIVTSNSNPIPDICYFDGAKSAQNATLMSGNGQTAIFYFQGQYSGDGATIICDTACYIYCWEDGCSNLNVSCKNGNNTCTISTTCYNAINSDICSDSQYVDVESWIPNVFEMDSFNPSSKYNSMDLCNSTKTNSLTCDAKYQCSDETVDTSNNQSGSGHYLSPICCSGYSSCTYASSLTSEIRLSTTYNQDNIAIRCDGGHSCTSIDYIRSMTNGGNLYFTGYSSLNDQSSVVANYYIHNNENVTSDVYCSGRLSCTDATLKNGRNLFSVASEAAYGSIINNFTNVYCIGYRSCNYGTMTNAQNIYCNGFFSCYQIQVDSINTLISLGYGAVYFDATINNIKTKAIGHGMYSLGYYVTLTGDMTDTSSLPYVKCVGDYCAYYCTISTFDSVTAIGIQAASYCTVSSIKSEINIVGSNAMYYGKIYNNGNDFDNTASKLNCTGYQACKLTTIRGVSSISVDGGNSLENATIYSEIYNGGTMEINVNDDNTKRWYLYCNVSDFCVINCLSDAACTNLYGNCDGTCKINCGSESGIDCPAIGQLTGNVSFASVHHPSEYPSHDPSNYPTINPTDESWTDTTNNPTVTNSNTSNETLATENGKTAKRRNDSISNTTIIVVISVAVVLAILIFGLIWVGKSNKHQKFGKKLNASEISMEEHVNKDGFGSDKNDAIVPATNNDIDDATMEEGLIAEIEASNIGVTQTETIDLKQVT